MKLGSDLVDCKLGETTMASVDETEVENLEQLEDRVDLDFTDKLWKVCRLIV